MVPIRGGYYADYPDPWPKRTESVLSEVWNSGFMRTIIPDNLTLSLGGIATLISPSLAGSGSSYNVTLLTRGKDAGLHLNKTTSERYGFEYGLSLNLSAGYFVGDSRNATYGSLLGTGADGSLQLGLGVGGWASYSNDGVSWAGGTIGIGPGAGGSVGLSNTVDGWW